MGMCGKEMIWSTDLSLRHPWYQYIINKNLSLTSNDNVTFQKAHFFLAHLIYYLSKAQWSN